MSARWRHAVESYRMLGWLSRGGFVGNQLSLLYPVIKFVTATFICGRQWLRFAFVAFGGAGKADMKMILVVPPWADFCEPIMMCARLAAQCLLDRRIHEDAGNHTVLCRRSDDFGVRMGPHLGINIATIRRHHALRQIELAFLLGKLMVGRWCEPDVHIEPDLMAGMAGEHRPTARLGHVAHEDAAPANFFGAFAEPFDKKRRGLDCPSICFARRA